jgi:hypothetical protein
MIKRAFVKYSGILVAFVLLVSSCGPNSDPKPLYPYPETERSTLVMYMLANNNLSSLLQNNVNDMLSAVDNRFPEIYNILVYWDGRYEQEHNASRLFKVVRPSAPGQSARLEELRDYGSQNSVDPEVMKMVLEDVKRFAPADNYAIAMGSHALGWIPVELGNGNTRMKTSSAPEHDFTPAPDALLTRWFGQDGASYMSITDLVEGLSPIYFDFILFDACFMASVEALYDLRHSADYIIASPAEIIGDGFPYAKVIPALFRNDRRVSLEQRLRTICDVFVSHYLQFSGTSRSAAIALVKTSALEPLAGSAGDVLAGATKEFDIADVQGLELLNPHAFFDLYDFMEKVCDDAALLEAFGRAFDDVVLLSGHTPEIYSAYGFRGMFDASRVKGLASYIPRTSLPLTSAAWYDTAWGKKMRERGADFMY